jgi:3-phenylpropionate/trans-cinnamate dioxygenase ferredoxin reductase subunit
MLGRREPFDAVPFFWSQHYDIAINYVGHAEAWDDAVIDGKLDAQDCTVTFNRGGRRVAVVTIGRDLQSLQAEHAIEEGAESFTGRRLPSGTS